MTTPNDKRSGQKKFLFRCALIRGIKSPPGIVYRSGEPPMLYLGQYYRHKKLLKLS